MAEDLAEIEVSHEEFKYVEKLLPKQTIPEPPQHSSYPTPSGWVAPTGNINKMTIFFKILQIETHLGYD